ncbi:hypothetical protein BH09BAC2_BH09BAC2_22260 [soil metagenome]
MSDIEVFCYNLKNKYLGKKLNKIKIVNGKKLKDPQAAFTKALQGRHLEDIYRSGKEFRFKFTGNKIFGMHLMLTGDIKLPELVNSQKSTIVEFYFEDAPALALTDRMKNANIKLDPVDKDGIDALSKALTFSKLKNFFTAKNIR